MEPHTHPTLPALALSPLTEILRPFRLHPLWPPHEHPAFVSDQHGRLGLSQTAHRLVRACDSDLPAAARV